jgi:hypothetical protein
MGRPVGSALIHIKSGLTDDNNKSNTPPWKELHIAHSHEGHHSDLTSTTDQKAGYRDKKGRARMTDT